MKPFRLIVAGSRDLDREEDRIALTQEVTGTVLSELLGDGYSLGEVITGDAARGADRFAYAIADYLSVPLTAVPAAWGDLDAPGAVIKEKNKRVFNARAGRDRNERMAGMADGLIAMWDGKSRGTRHMILCAREKGLRVWILNRRLPRGQ